MKIAFTSDWHVDASTAGVERYAEISEHVDRIVDACETESIDLVCFLGDAYDPGTLRDPRWSKFLAKSAIRLSAAAGFGVVMIPGNHDVVDSSEPLSTLSPIGCFDGVRHGMPMVAESPTCFTFGDDRNFACVLALPYVSNAFGRTKLYADRFALAIETARTCSQEGTPVVVIGHYSIAGIHPGSETDMVRGRELPFPAAAIASVNPTLVVNGHYHERQTIRVEGVEVEIVGSPARFTFGEADTDRGFLIAEV